MIVPHAVLLHVYTTRLYVRKAGFQVSDVLQPHSQQKII